MTLVICFCALVRAADWTEQVVPSHFLSSEDLPLLGIYVRVDVEGLGPLWLQLDTAIPQALLLDGRSLPSVPGV